MYSFIHLKFNNIFKFIFLKSIPFFLLSLGWIPLSDKFVASYSLVDSLGGEVSIYPSTIDLSINLFIIDCGVFLIPLTYQSIIP